MAFEVDIFQPRHMDEVVKSIPPVPTFMLDTFFKATKTFCTKEVDVDFVKGNRELAPFIHPKNGGEIVANTGYTTKTYKPPTIAPKKVTDEDVIMGRMAGETLYSSVTPAERAIRKQVEDFQELVDMNKRRKEWMACQAIFTGSIPIIGKGIDEEIDFGFSNTETIVDSDKKWDAATADPIADLKKWKRQVQKEGSVNCDICIMSEEVFDAFLRNETVQKLLDNRRVNLGLIKPKVVGEEVEYMGTLDSPALEIYVYNGMFLDNFSTPGVEEDKALVPEGTVTLLSSRANYGMYYGAVTVAVPEQKKLVTVEGENIPMTFIQEEPAALFFTMKSRPLPVPKQVDSWFVAHVL